MKKAIFILALVAASLTAQAQTTRDVSGNFIATPRGEKAAHDSTTTFTYTDYKGSKYPVYQGRKGGYYVWVISKKGNSYKKYIKED